MKKAKEIVRTKFEHSYKYADHLGNICADVDSTMVCQTYFNRQSHLKIVQEAPDESTAVSSAMNIFDNLPALKPPDATVVHDELDAYLSIARDLDVKDGIRWWHERKHLYPHLYRMALDYLSIPGKLWPFLFATGCSQYMYVITATSVDVERIFSQGRILLSHVRSRLSVQSTRALLCVGVWSLMDYVKDDDVKAAASLPEVDGDEEELPAGWDSVYIT